jgi:hypothetical protein
VKKQARKSKPIKLAMSTSDVSAGRSRRHRPWWRRPDELKDLARRLNARGHQHGIRSINPEYLAALQKAWAISGLRASESLLGTHSPQKRKALSARCMKANEQDHHFEWIRSPYQVVVYQSKGKGRGKRAKTITKYRWLNVRVFN